MMTDVGESISGMPGPPLGPSYLMTITVPLFTFPSSTAWPRGGGEAGRRARGARASPGVSDAPEALMASTAVRARPALTLTLTLTLTLALAQRRRARVRAARPHAHLEHVLLAVEALRDALKRKALLAGDLCDRALGRNIAVQDLQMAARLDR